MLVLIIERRNMTRMKANGLLRQTQNTSRTAEGEKLLFVALPDLTDAFPSTVYEILRPELCDAEMHRLIPDWIRMLCRSMRYVVDEEYGDRVLDSNTGVLAGYSCRLSWV
ncbi:hypothetical protein GGF50DRAFT_121242 [Schizophyllum commune]